MGTNEPWLGQVREEPIEPGLKICDAHHHLWAHREGSPEPRYLLDEFLTDLNSGHNIVSTVYVEVRSMHRTQAPEHMRPLGEVEFANGVAAMSASGLYGDTKVAAGIVGHADMTRGRAVGDVLDAMTAVARDRFRGIRHVAAWDADPEVRGHRKTPPGLLLDEDYRAGVRELGRRNLTFDAWCFHPQLQDLVAFAQAVPGTSIICNHCGGPLGIGSTYSGKRLEVLADWKHSMDRLATCPNVVVKLGGLFMVQCGFGWHLRSHPPTSDELADAARPYLDHLINAFGVDRCMFESNFPVEKVSCSYGVLWNAFKKVTATFAESEKAKLYHDNAARIYRLLLMNHSLTQTEP